MESYHLHHLLKKELRCKRTLDLSINWKGEKLGILEMRRHYSNYFKGFEGIKNSESN